MKHFITFLLACALLSCNKESVQPVQTKPEKPVKTEPEQPVKTEPASPVETEPVPPVKTEPVPPVKTEPVPPVKPARTIVYNKGVPGNVSAQLVERLDADVLSLKPQLVILMIGTNDISKKVPYDQYIANVSLLVNKIQVNGAKVILVSPPPRGIAEITKPTYFANDRNDHINFLIDSLSQQLNCYYLDINTAFKNVGSPNSTVSSYIRNPANNPAAPDGIHFTPDGAIFFTNQVAKFIRDNNLTDLKSIICFGDSLTAAMGYPKLLQTSLNQ